MRLTTSVLVAEASEDSRALIATVLEGRGYRVHQVARGDEVVALARQERPSLVLLDVYLPGMCGYEVCRELRAEFGPSLPIVLTSAERTEPYDRVAALELGADDFIAKPFVSDDLLARVDRLIRAAPSPPLPAKRRLSRRELEVLDLLADGQVASEIARELSISPKTVSNHIQNIFVKLDVHSQAHAVSVAFRAGLVANGKATLARSRDV